MTTTIAVGQSTESKILQKELKLKHQERKCPLRKDIPGNNQKYMSLVRCAAFS